MYHPPYDPVSPPVFPSHEKQHCPLCCQARGGRPPSLLFLLSLRPTQRAKVLWSLFSPSFSFEKCQTYRKGKRRVKWSRLQDHFIHPQVLMFCVTFAFSPLLLSLNTYFFHANIRCYLPFYSHFLTDVQWVCIKYLCEHAVFKRKLWP